MVRVFGRLLVCVLALGVAGCATAATREPAVGVAPSGSPRDRAGPPEAEDVDILRERVTRLERRLADVDAKLGLLLAQRQQGPARERDERVRASARPGEVWPGAAPREEASLGARSVDLPPRGGAAPEGLDDELLDAGADGVRSRGAVDDGPEVVIRLDGRGVSADESPASGAPQINLGASVDEVYQWGQARLKSGQILEAIAAFEDVTERAAAHDLADNAMYWIGYSHARRGDHRLALDVWQRLPIRYPKSPKIADALYGMAQSHEALGEPALAETLYLEVVTQYPRAEKVRESHKALRRLRPR